MRVRSLMTLAFPLLVCGAACGSVKESDSDASTTTDDATPAVDVLPGPDRDDTADAQIITVPDAAGVPDAIPGPDGPPGCDTCYELITGMGDFMTACPASLMLYEAWVNCLCMATTCGDFECAMECSGAIGGDPMTCSDCINTVSMPGGICESQTNACLADM